jgi:hypothetical protein
MKVIICGSRKLFLEPSEVEQAIILSGFKITELVCGLAKGTKDCYHRAKKQNLKMYLHNTNGLMTL